MITTRYFSTDDLAAAADLLRTGQLVAFPTETVYGLGANALDTSAVEKIFAAKGRPSDNPLIVHIASRNDLDRLVGTVSEDAKKLMDQFWPGPLTLVLAKNPIVPDSVTAGLDTVAVRIPAHSIALELIRLSGVPVAAPSANRSGRPSATTWQAVAEDLEGRIAGIVRGQPTQLGIESTVVDASTARVTLLRHGGISLETLREIIPDIQTLHPRPTEDPHSDHELSRSPGLRHRHYQPKAKIVLVSNIADIPWSDQENAFFIGLHQPKNAPKQLSIHLCDSIEKYAHDLFDYFRQADQNQAQTVYCERVSEYGLGAALMDRLTRASQP